MKQIAKTFGLLVMCALPMIFSSCNKDNEEDEIFKALCDLYKTEIVGSWIEESGSRTTDQKEVFHFDADNTGYAIMPREYEEWGFEWGKKMPMTYRLDENTLYMEFKHGPTFILKDISMTFQTVNNVLAGPPSDLWYFNFDAKNPSGKKTKIRDVGFFWRIKTDYSNAILGMWEGVEVTGNGTYNDYYHRIEFKEDGTFTYYSNENDEWQPREDDYAEWFVVGKWLSMRWKNKDTQSVKYECWDIGKLADGEMKWGAERKAPVTNNYYSYTWKRVED